MGGRSAVTYNFTKFIFLTAERMFCYNSCFWCLDSVTNLTSTVTSTVTYTVQLCSIFTDDIKIFIDLQMRYELNLIRCEIQSNAFDYNCLKTL